MQESGESSVKLTAKELFMVCLEAKDDTHREELLASADPDVAQEVRELLAAQGDGAIVEKAFEIDETHDLTAMDSIGKTIGNFKLLEQIGEGGMGTVYMAQQLKPVRRKVALKVIKPGMDSRQVVSRFEAERQALALMDHPNIAKVFDGGTTDAGLPFFVMELVRGIPLTDFAERQSSSVRNRLELFLDLCAGIQHAHQRGIIHRDLKPSNVLVTLHDDQPVVKVIDFGIAKAMNQELTDKTLFTQFAAMVGTPLYMSPEQAELSGLDVDMRSDVYSLGVMLYELLTGTPPFDRKTMKDKGLDEIRRMIRETTPPRPSQRLSTIHASGVETNEVAMPIGDLQRLRSELVGELDWIVMKAIEKQRERRYESVREFADDVQRHLDGQVVRARPPKWSYLARKWVANHQVITSTLMTIACVIAIAFALVWYQRGEAISQADRANELAAIEANQRKELEDNLDRERKLQEQLRNANELGARQLYWNQIRLAASEWRFGNAWLGEATLTNTDTERRNWEYEYLRGLMNRDRVATFDGHTQPILFVAFLERLDRVISAQSDRVYIWSRTAVEENVTIKLDSPLKGVAIDPKRNEIALLLRTTDKDSSIAIHEVPSGRLLRQQTIKSFLGNEIEYHPDGDVIATCNGLDEERGIVFLNPSDLRRFKVELLHWGASQVIFSSRVPERFLAIDTMGAVVEHKVPLITDTEYVDPGEFKLVKTEEMIFDLEEPIDQSAWSDSAQLVATSQVKEPSARIWRLNPKGPDYNKSLFLGIFGAPDCAELVATLSHPGQVYQLVFDEKGKQLITGSADAIVRIWDLKTNQVIREFKGHDSPVHLLDLHRNGRWLVSADENHRCIVWDLKKPLPPDSSSQATDKITCMAIDSSDQRVFVGTERGLCGVFDLESESWVRWKTVHSGAVSDIKVSGDGRRILTSGYESNEWRYWELDSDRPVVKKDVRYWDLDSDRPLAKIESEWSQSAVILPGEDQVAIGGDIFSLADGEPLHEDSLDGVAMDTEISSDGTRLVTVIREQRFRVYNRVTHQVVMDLPALPGAQGTVAISPNGQYVLCTGSDSQEVKLVDLGRLTDAAEAESATIALTGHVTNVVAAKFINDERIASASTDGVIRIWDVKSPRSILTLSSGGYPITDLAISGDGKTIYAACSDKTIKSWAIDLVQ